MNKKARLEFDLAVQDVGHYAMSIPDNTAGLVAN